MSVSFPGAARRVNLGLRSPCPGCLTPWGPAWISSLKSWSQATSSLMNMMNMEEPSFRADCSGLCFSPPLPCSLIECHSFYYYYSLCDDKWFKHFTGRRGKRTEFVGNLFFKFRVFLGYFFDQRINDYKGIIKTNRLIKEHLDGGGKNQWLSPSEADEKNNK